MQQIGDAAFIALIALCCFWLARRSDEFGAMWARSNKQLYGESEPEHFYQRFTKFVGYGSGAVFLFFSIMKLVG